MRSAANPRRNDDSLARMLAAVAAASLATISGAPATKPTMPATMQSHHKPPAVLAWARGDTSKILFVISVVLTVYFSLGVRGAMRRRDRTRLRNWHLGALNQKPEHNREFSKQNWLRPFERGFVVTGKEQRCNAQSHVAETVDH